MPASDPQAVRADVIEYYRLVLEGRKKDPHAREAAKADAAILKMVRETPDVVAMNRAFTSGGLSFNLMRGIAVDGATHQAETYAELGEEALAAAWRKRAAALATAADAAEIYAVTDRMDREEAPAKENAARLKWCIDTIIEKLFLVAASPPGTGLDDQPKGTLVASRDELAQRFPGLTFAAAVKLPSIRPRLSYDDAALARLTDLFARVNREWLGGKY